jgi:uncharacterized protein (DUF2126 family)
MTDFSSGLLAENLAVRIEDGLTSAVFFLVCGGLSVQTVSDLFWQEIVTLDRAIEARLPGLWIGAEPTFTVRDSEQPEWLSEPLGGDKEPLAHTLMARLRERHCGSLVLRTLGRQYQGEALPRWSIGLYGLRDGGPLWEGPPDPLDGATLPLEPERLLAFLDSLLHGLMTLGWSIHPFKCQGSLPHRLVFRIDGEPLGYSEEDIARWSRESLHQQPVPLSGLKDELAEAGEYLLAIGTQVCEGGESCVTLELPAFPDAVSFRAFIKAVEGAATVLPTLILQGFPPPVDAEVMWTTLTPDPAVIEINQAPYANTEQFLAASRELYEVSEAIGLSPFRLHYNGNESDSGGGGQFTLGGKSPQLSPFLTCPGLLARVVRYWISHPVLSYGFAPDYLGGSSQSPRADEGIRALFHELRLALFHLERQATAEPEFIWRSLAPFLADASGNSHRSDLNIEKLWNPYLPGRGCQGLVEFRAFRMSSTPERAAALSQLLRALVAMLSVPGSAGELIDWGDKLHDRFALPYYLRQDLLAVFNDLEVAGLGLGEKLRQTLLDTPARTGWQIDFGGCRLEIERALEFWPLVGGDAKSQESGGSRLVDASTVRWQLMLRPGEGGDSPELSGWQLEVEGLKIPLSELTDEAGPLRLSSIRLREFEPWLGLHPAVKPRMPLTLMLRHPEQRQALRLQIHAWQPEGLPYPGLPADRDEAEKRRQQRLTRERVDVASLDDAVEPPVEAVSRYGIDLRWLLD